MADDVSEGLDPFGYCSYCDELVYEYPPPVDVRSRPRQVFDVEEAGDAPMCGECYYDPPRYYEVVRMWTTGDLHVEDKLL